MVPERHNVVKVLLLLDIGGSMDDHVRTCEELFSAARSRVQAPAAFLFPQLPVRGPVARQSAPLPEHVGTVDLMRTYGSDYKLIFVGDATMSPYEVTTAGGSVEHWNAEPGSVWLARLTRAYPEVRVDQPPTAGALAPHRLRRADPASCSRIGCTPLTLSGLDDAIDALG